MFITLLCFFGFLAGHLASILGCWFVDRSADPGVLRCRSCESRRPLATLLPFLSIRRCGQCCSAGCRWPAFVAFLAGVVFVALGTALVTFQCQTVAEVRPDSPLWQNRLPFHLSLIFLLLIITVTDFLEYSIPDAVVLSGSLIALVTATVSGELQLIHVWVNWDYEMVELYGPYLPDWMKHHQHLHGFVWSFSGLIAGASLVWMIRQLSNFILGQPAVGFGDVTLMAMIGAYLGWQPTLCALIIAPLAGIAVGAATRLITGRSFVAFGPYLAAAAVIVLFSWRYLWEVMLLRQIFSHWPTIAGLIIGTFVLLSILLAGVRMYRTIPLDRIRS
jgi:leader peptidase (prepilin peptidase)/N-methyltransferase